MSSILVLVREDPVSLLWDVLGEWCQPQGFHRKSDSVVEAGRPATEGDWIPRVTIGERQRKDRKQQRESSQTKTSLRANQDATTYLAKRGVVWAFKLAVGVQKAGRAHLTIVNLHC